MAEISPIPAASLPLAVRAPGKCILFGEHAVVHGAPELVVRDRPLRPGLRSTVVGLALNGDPGPPRRTRTSRGRSRPLWSDGPPIDVRGHLPQSPARRDSAPRPRSRGADRRARLGDRGDRPVRRWPSGRSRSNEAAQGVGSPGDTSAVVGRRVPRDQRRIGVADSGPSRTATRRWTVRRVTDPRWVWVVAYTGIPRYTAEAVRAVGERLAEPDGPALLARVPGGGADGGMRGGGPRGSVRGRGTPFSRTRSSCGRSASPIPRIEDLLEAAAPAADGAKLTGAGAGGSIVVPPDPREGDRARATDRARRWGAVRCPSGARGASLSDGAPASPSGRPPAHFRATIRITAFGSTGWSAASARWVRPSIARMKFFPRSVWTRYATSLGGRPGGHEERIGEHPVLDCRSSGSRPRPG